MYVPRKYKMKNKIKEFNYLSLFFCFYLRYITFFFFFEGKQNMSYKNILQDTFKTGFT